MNSGSESVTGKSRIADVNARKMTGQEALMVIKLMAVEKAFHGHRRPAQISTRVKIRTTKSHNIS